MLKVGPFLLSKAVLIASSYFLPEAAVTLKVWMVLQQIMSIYAFVIHTHLPLVLLSIFLMSY